MNKQEFSTYFGALCSADPDVSRLEYGDALRLSMDYKDAHEMDGDDAASYLRRIGKGNLRSYLNSLVVMEGRIVRD